LLLFYKKEESSFAAADERRVQDFTPKAAGSASTPKNPERGVHLSEGRSGRQRRSVGAAKPRGGHVRKTVPSIRRTCVPFRLLYKAR